MNHINPPSTALSPQVIEMAEPGREYSMWPGNYPVSSLETHMLIPLQTRRETWLTQAAYFCQKDISLTT